MKAKFIIGPIMVELDDALGDSSTQAEREWLIECAIKNAEALIKMLSSIGMDPQDAMEEAMSAMKGVSDDKQDKDNMYG